MSPRKGGDAAGRVAGLVGAGMAGIAAAGAVGLADVRSWRRLKGTAGAGGLEDGELNAK
jgi:hypothetical protein